MPFTEIPQRLKFPTRTRHTELLAVFGEAGARFRDHDIVVSLAGETLHFQVQRKSGPSASWIYSTSTWSWGAPKAETVAREGRLLAARADGLVIIDGGTDDKDRQLFDLWRGSKRVRSAVGPSFSFFAPEAVVVHGQLFAPSRIEGLALIPLDKDKPYKLFAQRPKDKEGYQPGLSVAEAPEGGVVVCDGATLAIHDLRTGKLRSEVKGPAHLYMSGPVLSADGRIAVVCTTQREKVKRPKDGPAAGFLAIDLKTGKVLAELNAQKPFPRGVAFVLGGKAVVTVSDTEGSIALWDTTTWKLLEKIELEKGTDYASPNAIFAWDSQDAFVYRGLNGSAYVFKASLEPVQAAGVKQAGGAKQAAEPVPPAMAKKPAAAKKSVAAKKPAATKTSVAKKPAVAKTSAVGRPKATKQRKIAASARVR